MKKLKGSQTAQMSEFQGIVMKRTDFFVPHSLPFPLHMEKSRIKIDLFNKVTLIFPL
jgi:hypothetical protein